MPNTKNWDELFDEGLEVYRSMRSSYGAARKKHGVSLNPCMRDLLR